jgi:hypothetical protein
MSEVFMKRYIILLLLALWLVGCGAAPSQPPQPQSFLSSDTNGVALLTWTKADQGSQITSGSYETTTAQATQSEAVTGQQPDATHVTLQLADLGEAWTGTITGATLSITTDTGSRETWYAGTSEQYSQLQALYHAYALVQSDLSKLASIEGAPPDNSYAGFYQSALQGAQNRVQDEQASLAYIQAQSDPLNRCIALESFSANYPPYDQDPELQLPFSQPSDQGPQPVVDRSDLSKVITTLSNDAKQAAALPVPAIQGLPLPWKADPGPQIAEARQQLQALKSVIFATAKQFPPLREAAQQIQAQEAMIAQQHQCFG